MIFTYGPHTIDTATLPQASIDALLSRGLSHYLGNEQASKVTSRIRTAVSNDLSTPEREVNQKDITTEQVKDFRANNEDVVAGWAADVTASAVAALGAGTIGQRAVGEPKATQEESIVKNLASAEVISILVTQGLLKAGTKAVKAATEFTFNAGTDAETKVEFGTLVSRRTAKHSERLASEAAKEMARREREAAKVAKGTEGEAIDDLLAD